MAGPGPATAYAEHAQALLAHAVTDDTRRKAWHLLDWLLYWLIGAQSHTTSIAVGTIVTAHYERILGPDHPDTLRSRGNLVNAYREAGRLDEATALLDHRGQQP